MVQEVDNGGLIGHMVPFLIGMPSVKAMIMGISPNGQYILQQDYDTQDENGGWHHVTKTIYRDKYWIEAYRSDEIRLAREGNDSAGIE